MSSNSKKTKTFDIKKNERHLSKKRKLEAFLNLVRKEDPESTTKKKISNFQESYKSLKDELKQYQKKEISDPLFYPIDDGKNALVKFSSNIRNLTSIAPLFVEDIYHLLLKSIIGNLSPFSLKWSKLERPQSVSKTVVIEIDNLSEEHIFQLNSELNQKCNIFRYIFEVISSSKPFATELSTMHMVENFYNNTKGNLLSALYPLKEKSPERYIEEQTRIQNEDMIHRSAIADNTSSMPVCEINDTVDNPTENMLPESNKILKLKDNHDVCKEKEKNCLEEGEIIDSSDETDRSIESSVTSVGNDKNYKVSKLHLLLSPIQLAMEQFPLPSNVFKPSKSRGFKFTKDSYIPVTENSPMFAIDCEMCFTTNNLNELTHVAIVNENLDTVYETLVKPKAKIINYLTKYSGITKEMLVNVKTTLEDVQRDIRNLLPPDAILVGQSLNSDLMALKLIHPYVIDTSVIFNNNGVRRKKVGLKKLVLTHLNEVIQDTNKIGHSPVEDSIGAMKLVQFKLQNTIWYGDKVLSNAIESNSNIKDNCEKTESTKEETVKQNTHCEFSEDVEVNVNNKESKSDIGENKSDLKDIKEPEYVQLDTGPEYCGFFERITKCYKKACLIGNKEDLNNYRFDFPSENVTKVVESKNKEISKTMSSCLESNHFVIGHLHLNPELEQLDEINECVKDVFHSLPHNALFILLAGKKVDVHFKHRFCMTILKDTKKLQKQI